MKLIEQWEIFLIVLQFVRFVFPFFFFFFSKSLLYFNLSGIQALLKDVFLDTVTGLRY